MTEERQPHLTSLVQPLLAQLTLLLIHNWRECVELSSLLPDQACARQRPLRSTLGTAAECGWRRFRALRERTDVTDVSQRAGLTRSVSSSIEFHEELLTLVSLHNKGRGYTRIAVKTGGSENFPPL